jgi:hypothetical protein
VKGWRRRPTQLSGVLKGERVRERALRSRTLTHRRSITLPLCVLAAGAIHGLAVMALLPMMITLPGPGADQRGTSQPVAVDVMPASAAAPPVLVPHDPETTAAIPAIEDQPVAAPAPDRDADDAEGDDEIVPAEPGMAAAPEPPIAPATTILTPVAARIPDSLPAAEPASAPEVSDPAPPAVEDALHPPEADDETPSGKSAAPVARVEPARLDGSAAESAPAAAVEQAEPEADAVEEDVPPPTGEAAKEAEPHPEAKARDEPPPVPVLKPAKSPELKARRPAPQKKAGAVSAKRGTSHARRSVRTRTVTTVTQGGLFQNLFGPPSRRSTKKQ